MGWLNRFKKDESAISELSKKIYEYSLFCAEPLKKELEEKFGKNSKECLDNYFRICFEFMVFFLHITNRSAFLQLGHEKRVALQNKLYPIVIDPTIETVFKGNAKESIDKIKDEFHQKVDDADEEYSKCKKIFLPPQDDVDPLTRIAFGGMVKSRGMLNQLIDRVATIITGQPMNDNAQFPLLIIDNVLNILKKNEIDKLVLKASKEI